jgi:hypothetical protein
MRHDRAWQLEGGVTMNADEHPENRPNWSEALRWLKDDPERQQEVAEADVIFGVDVGTGRQILVYGRELLGRISASGEASAARKLPRLTKKLRVVVSWTLDLFFGKDIEQLVTVRDVDAVTRQLERMRAREGRPTGTAAP